MHAEALNIVIYITTLEELTFEIKFFHNQLVIHTRQGL